MQTFFDSTFLTDAEKTLSKEYLLTNGRGTYCASTISGCNTRKYHGLLVTPQPQIDGNDHVVISALEEEVTYGREKFRLATHKYPNVIFPEGYKYMVSFHCNPILTWTYKMDGCTLVKELMLQEDEDAVWIRYTVEEAEEKVQMDLRPLLAFRNVHELKYASFHADNKTHAVSNGIKVKLYPEYLPAYIQVSKKADFIAAPDWYYKVEYPQEQSRGYAYAEDLYAPGQFHISLKKGDKLVVALGLHECKSQILSTRFSSILNKRQLPDTGRALLVNAARQFVIKQGDTLKIKAGYYWFGAWGRDTFISLPGLLLTTGRYEEFKQVIRDCLPDLKNGLFPNIGTGSNAVYNSVDASLWFIWAIQQYAIFTNAHANTWEQYGRHLTEILESYRNGTLYNIKMDDDGLISAAADGVALTWMDAVVDGAPVTPRPGKPVEINALWYNAICFCLYAAEMAGDKAFVTRWESYPQLIGQSFMAMFWDNDRQYLADCVCDNAADWSLRPNQVFALSMPYSPVPEDCRIPILDVVKKELLTVKGLRTLAPEEKSYQGKCEGDQKKRDLAYHQGTVWPWLLGHFAEAYLNTYGLGGIAEVEKIYNGCLEMLDDLCLNSIPEIYNGDSPHKAVGAVAQAWSVAEALRIEYLLTKIKRTER